MPTYEFRCPLGHEFEKFYRSISRAEAQVACPECGQIAERMMSAGAGLVFKGSGFYLTDYGKNAHRGTESGKPDGGKPDGGKSEGATGEGAKSDGAKASPEGGSSASAGDSAKSESKPEPKAAESKPAPPSKPSSGE